MRLYLIILLVFGFSLSADLQTLSSEEINERVRLIEEDSLTHKSTFNISDVYQISTDGGGSIEVLNNETGIVKITEMIGTSYGRTIKTIYLENSEAIKIIEIEDNFLWNEETSGWNFSELLTVFKASIYISDYKKGKTTVVMSGERNLSEGNCDLSNFSPLIETAQSLIK